jgi:hypothetical protein
MTRSDIRPFIIFQLYTLLNLLLSLLVNFDIQAEEEFIGEQECELFLSYEIIDLMSPLCIDFWKFVSLLGPAVRFTDWL